MEYSYKTEDGKGVYTLTGSLIGEHDGMPLADHFNEQIEKGTTRFAINLSALRHINSSGLGVLITLLTKARKKDGELVLVNPSDYIRNLMMITKLNTIFATYKDDQSAISAL